MLRGKGGVAGRRQWCRHGRPCWSGVLPGLKSCEPDGSAREPRAAGWPRWGARLGTPRVGQTAVYLTAAAFLDTVRWPDPREIKSVPQRSQSLTAPPTFAWIRDGSVPLRTPRAIKLRSRRRNSAAPTTADKMHNPSCFCRRLSSSAPPSAQPVWALRRATRRYVSAGHTARHWHFPPFE